MYQRTESPPARCVCCELLLLKGQHICSLCAELKHPDKQVADAIRQSTLSLFRRGDTVEIGGRLYQITAVNQNNLGKVSYEAGCFDPITTELMPHFDVRRRPAGSAHWSVIGSPVV